MEMFATNDRYGGGPRFDSMLEEMDLMKNAKA